MPHFMSIRQKRKAQRNRTKEDNKLEEKNSISRHFFCTSKTQGTQFIPIEQRPLKDFEVEDDEGENKSPTSKS
ncbi:unnamed protein product [Taenia asiatica]|uniref:Ovule protein n=1 Tax=Taenia asiatica TaxID=60517 RepID=A0A0R3VVF2_TAEAS|nr:unnamed protein product [Taenia asiatica]